MKECPTPWKMTHPTPQAAYAAAAKIAGQAHYRCPGCGLWHVATGAEVRQANMAKSSKARHGQGWKRKRRRLSKAERALRNQFRRTS